MNAERCTYRVFYLVAPENQPKCSIFEMMHTQTKHLHLETTISLIIPFSHNTNIFLVYKLPQA